MKKFQSLLVFAVIVTLISGVMLLPSKAKSSGPLSKALPATTLPDSIQKIVQKACMDCHADDGNGMAKAHINFSKWDTYKYDKQVEKSKDICKVLGKGSMPPKGFRKSHPDVIPTDAEVTIICKWADSLNK
jgi:cytochrome c5